MYFSVHFKRFNITLGIDPIAELLNATLSKLVESNPSTETLDLGDIKKNRLTIVLKHLTSIFTDGLGDLEQEAADEGLLFSDAQIDDLKKILVKFDKTSSPEDKKVGTVSDFVNQWLDL